jgi:hypothetical protein
MKGVCKICDCTDDHACIKEDGQPCSWVTSDLCDACCLIQEPQAYGKPGMIIPKMCAFCGHLIDLVENTINAKRWYTCSKDRIKSESSLTLGDYQWFAWSGIWRPNKTVKAAQKKCPHWEVVPDVSKIHRRGRE